MVNDRLIQVAKHHFRNMRTECEFMHIHSYKRKGEYFTFFAYFKCKKRVIIKKVKVTKHGEIG